jgi:CMP-N-acetylneuraminic acid synthetase
VLLLQPTSPLRTSQDIQQAHQAVLESQADAIIGLTPVAHHPGWMKVIDDHGIIQDYLPLSLIPARRQDLPPVYIPNGAIYIIRRITLLESRSFVPPNTISFIMTSERSVDIDTPWDFQIAEWILQASPNHADHPDR